MIVLVLALLAAWPTLTAQAALPDAESRMLGHLNSARAANGLSALSSHDGLRGIARNWAAQMASDYEASGSRQQALRHNPSLSSQLPGNYRRAGENVGYTVMTGASHATLVDRLHDAYMASSGHRANILGEFDRVGVGLTTAEDGTMWSAVVFMLERAPEPEPEPEPEPQPDPQPQRDPEPQPDPEPQSERQSASAAQPASSSPAAEAAAEPEPVPDPPTTEDLFGSDWPQGYLAGDPDAARGLLAGRPDVRRVMALLPGAGSPAARSLVGVRVPGS